MTNASGAASRGPWAVRATAALLLGMPLGACKIEKTVVAPPRSETSVFINDASFDPDKMVAADWDARILPLLRGKARPYDDVVAAIATDPDSAGKTFGYRPGANGGPWTYATRVEGTVTAADTQSRAATIEVRTASGRTVTLQIGPVVRGTAIRDMLDFRPFGSFKNQVDYAQYGKALNAKANGTTLAKVPREDLVGRPVTALGVFQSAEGGTAPLVTPIEIAVGPKS